MKRPEVKVWFQVRLACGHMSPMQRSVFGDVRHPRILEPARKLLRQPDACVHPECQSNRRALASLAAVTAAARKTGFLPRRRRDA